MATRRDGLSLSEHEMRQLRSIEMALRGDRSFAAQFEGERGARFLAAGVATFVAGLVLFVATFAWVLLLGFAGCLAMAASVLLVQRGVTLGGWAWWRDRVRARRRPAAA